MKEYLTNLAIKEAGYPSLKSFCDIHEIKIDSIYQHNFRNRKNDYVRKDIELILRAEKAEKQILILQKVFNINLDELNKINTNNK